ncbi:MAG: hypothetical protein RLZZ600_945 [Actinomycetota bacterium]
MSENPWENDDRRAVRKPSRDVEETPDVPFVLDLPDGQKLLVGELPEGTIIEVAAWRGTAKPDSRTLRLLLGVSNKKVTEEEEPVVVSDGQTIEPPKRSRIRARLRLRTTWIVLLSIAVVLLIGGIAFSLSPLKIAHPSTGINLGFGPANSSLAVVAPESSVEVGQTLIAQTGSGKSVVGRVAAKGQGIVLLQGDKGFTQVNESEVEGSVLFVIPFLGYIAP